MKTFKSEQEAELWLSQYRLVTVRAYSPDDINTGYTHAGIIWGSDTQPPVKAADVPVAKIPWDDIKAKRARIFGAGGSTFVEQKSIVEIVKRMYLH